MHLKTCLIKIHQEIEENDIWKIWSTVPKKLYFILEV